MTTGLLAIAPLWIVLLSIGGIVYARDPDKAANRSMLTFVVMLVFWSASVKALYLESSLIPPFWCGRLAFVGASLSIVSFVLLALCFPDQSNVTFTTSGRWLVRCGLGVGGLSLTPWMVSHHDVLANGSIKLHYGPVYPVFSVFLLLSFGYGVGHLIQKWRRARGRERLQIQYLLIGFVLTFIGSATTNLVMPMLTGSSQSSQYGPYFLLFLVGLTAHAMIRHRFMDSRLVVRTSVTYALSLGVIASLLWSLFTLWESLWGAERIVGSTSMTMLVGLGSVVLFHPLQVGMKRLFDTYCYRDIYDYRRATAVISQELPGLMQVEPLCEYLTTFLVSALKVESAAVYVFEQQTALRCQTSYGRRDDWAYPAQLPALDGVDLLVRMGQPLLREEDEAWRGARESAAMEQLFSDLQSAVLIPLLADRRRLAAVIAIGDKLSGDPFFHQDVALLTTIQHQASVAFRRAELYEEVALMHEYTENILRQMKSGVIAVNAEGLITVVNEAAAALLRQPAEQLLQHDCRDVLDRGLSNPLRLALTEDVIYTEHETTLSLSEQGVLPLVLGTSTLHAPGGELAGAILVFHDLSRIKQLAAEKQCIERLASIGAFAGKVAHEVKNPLVAIKTLAELLPEQYDDEEFRTTFTRIALQEVERIDNLVRRLRGLKAPTDIRMAPLHILAPLEQTLELIAAELQKRHIDVTRQYGPQLPEMIGSSDQLKQVFLNICLNSAEAMAEGGSLHIAVDAEADRDPREIVMTFTDTGPGIRTDVIDTIFEAHVTSKQDGSGLGMAICKDIVELHRGAISAANRSDTSGAIFTIRLPASQGDLMNESYLASHGLAATTDPVAECVE